MKTVQICFSTDKSRVRTKEVASETACFIFLRNVGDPSTVVGSKFSKKTGLAVISSRGGRVASMAGSWMLVAPRDVVR